MKKPRCKYKNKIKTEQMFSIKNKKIFFRINLTVAPNLNHRQSHTRDFPV